jgi:hypothetical protein
VTLVSSDASCVVAPASITASAGQSIGTATLSDGGSTTHPCTATVTASSTLFGSDTVQVTVGKAPDLGAMTIADIYWGNNNVGSSLKNPYRVTPATGSQVQVSLARW